METVKFIMVFLLVLIGVSFFSDWQLSNSVQDVGNDNFIYDTDGNDITGYGTYCHNKIMYLARLHRIRDRLSGSQQSSCKATEARGWRQYDNACTDWGNGGGSPA